MKSRQAQCSCGQLVLTTEAEPIRISVCHCYACQRRTGSIFGVQARFQESDVNIAGRSKQYTRISDDGNKVNFFFCPECGSTVFYRLEQIPDTIGIPVGAFADSDFPAPRISVYEDHQHPWISFKHNLEHFD